MPEIDWEAIENLLQPLYPGDPLRDWASARRVAHRVTHLGQGLKPFFHDKAHLLALLSGLAGVAAEPTKRVHLTRPLKVAGVPLEDQMWAWVALPRFAHTPESHEEQAVHDARLLETVGALGVARAMLLAGQKGENLQSAILAAHQALDRAEFLTPAGRRLGVRRVVSARRFLKELEEE